MFPKRKDHCLSWEEGFVDHVTRAKGRRGGGGFRA